MSILRLLFQLFVVYMLYKLIFDFIIPVYKTSIRMKQKMNEMNERNQQPPAKEDPAPSKKAVSADYIDYEEIK
ncbi:MAG TPA: hypothetical protein VK498_00080 [Ferruginibacter sp.]|nr:hypothetical protein [Ferruginibacter sp.]